MVRGGDLVGLSPQDAESIAETRRSLRKRPILRAGWKTALAARPTKLHDHRSNRARWTASLSQADKASRRRQRRGDEVLVMMAMVTPPVSRVRGSHMTASKLGLSLMARLSSAVIHTRHISAIRHKQTVGELEHERALRVMTAISAATLNNCLATVTLTSGTR